MRAVVKDIKEALSLCVDTLGFKSSNILTAEEDGVKTVMVSMREITVEFTERIDPRSGLQKFLETWGEGMCHICFEVDNIRRDPNALAISGAY